MAYDPEIERIRRWATRAKVGAEIVYFITPEGTGEYEPPPEIFAAARRAIERGNIVPFQRKVWRVRPLPGHEHNPMPPVVSWQATEYLLRRVSPAGLKALTNIAKIKPERATYVPDR